MSWPNPSGRCVIAIASIAFIWKSRRSSARARITECAIRFSPLAPIVERLPDSTSRTHGLRLAGPAALDQVEEEIRVTPWTVDAEEYGDFLIAIYGEWVRHDVGKVFVMNFERALNAWIGNPSPVCTRARQCGRSLVIEYNGDAYACDHSVYPQYRLGNIGTDSLNQMPEKSLQSGFGIATETVLPRWCRECDVLSACQGGCPKHGFAKTVHDESGLNISAPGIEDLSPYPQIVKDDSEIARKRVAGILRDGRRQGAAGDHTGDKG